MTNLPATAFSNFDNDFKAEVIAAEMVEHGTPADRILILMAGALKRSFRKDVDGVEEEISEYDHKEYTLLRTPREGIYDMLPEGLFHEHAAPRSLRSEKDVIKMMKQRRAEELNARKFFLPFEATINHLRMLMAMYENKLDKRSHYTELLDIFKDQWEIFQYLDSRQSNIFLHLIPILHDVRDMHDSIEEILQTIFELPVEIQLCQRLPEHPAEPILSLMGESRLGIDLTTGSRVYDEGIDEIIVTIGPVSSEMRHQFMDGRRNEKILELLCDYLLPVHMDVVKEFIVEEKYRLTRLADSEGKLNSVLGADTWL
ncbi:type VI secretion system baseplate subunit TssG [Danxiaibacter flavus]|uniref:Type VI secretion system baseplate subunit TssG n=1 Tax=Danxiaibacter flavus TaxID=3049108 RepID=A0ABV3ZE26_9BACT|nr:type VI secretion system baseplate subunit TssG [Chitinophagaceae bacterium DXS]